MLLLSPYPSVISSTLRYHLDHNAQLNHLPVPFPLLSNFLTRPLPFSSTPRPILIKNLNFPCCASPVQNNIHPSSDGHTGNENGQHLVPEEPREKKSFWAAVSLIIGTAVGPGMLGLPSATIRSGPFPSTIAILLSWVYVISSIILVAELSFATMEEDRVAEVSFTGLASEALGTRFGALVAVIYASLTFSLLVACVSGIGSIVAQWFPSMNSVIAHALFPIFVASVLCFFPFNAIDAANRFLCFVMLISITALVFIGLSTARANVLSSFSYASWLPSSILPAIPVTVLTLGFHVITPFICKVAGNTVVEARKAILFGGSIPLIMVLSWNAIVLGLSGIKNVSPKDPISLLLSINPSALSAVQGFAFSALATSLIGYAVSFPKQLLDTFELISGIAKSSQHRFQHNFGGNEGKTGRIGFITYSGRGKGDIGNVGEVSYSRPDCITASGFNRMQNLYALSSLKSFVVLLVLGIPVLIASNFSSTFSKAVDFAGVYANCFLFGILPPVMTFIYQSRKKVRLSVLPGGNITLLLLLATSVILAIWH